MKTKAAAASAAESPAKGGFRMPAEWARHEGTWLTWPNSQDWPGKLQAVRWVYGEIAKHLSRQERVHLVIPSREDEARVTSALRRADINLEQLDFLVSPTDRTWARDNLPLFVTSAEASGTLGAVKFRFNGWARYPDHELDDKAGIQVARHAADRVWQPQVTLEGKPWRFVLEGGAIDVDGEGTLLTTRRCLLGAPYARNPGLSQAEVEAVLKAHLGVKKVLWLEDGIAGDDTSGHIDDFARFVKPGVVVCAEEREASDANYQPLQAALEVLRSAKDARGKGLEVVPLPMPAPLRFDGERLPASYANFYIANNLVLVPTFNDPNDREALGILAELFADRQVIGIHAVDLVVGLGTLHCSTQQQPAV